jgi:hypothetical protein
MKGIKFHPKVTGVTEGIVLLGYTSYLAGESGQAAPEISVYLDT